MSVLGLVVLAALGTVQVQSLGQAPIVSGDKVKARSQALEEAMRNAVEAALATVAQQDVPRAAALVRQSNKLRTYVPTYRVMAERETVGDLFEVQIEAQVALALLRKDLQPEAVPGAGGSSGQKHTVLVALSGETAQAIVKVLRSQGYGVVAGKEGSDAEVAEQSRGANAALAVTGSIQISREGRVRGTDVESALAVVMLRMLDTKAQALVQSRVQARRFEASASEAASKAEPEAAEAAIRQLLDRLGVRASAEAKGESRLVIQVAGLRNVRELEALERQLSSLVKAEPRRLGDGVATLVVRGEQDGTRVAELLRRQGLQVEGATEREIRVRAGGGI